VTGGYNELLNLDNFTAMSHGLLQIVPWNFARISGETVVVVLMLMLFSCWIGCSYRRCRWQRTLWFPKTKRWSQSFFPVRYVYVPL